MNTLEWKLDLKGGTLTWTALHTDAAEMFLDDAIADGETQACAFAGFFGCKKGLVNSLNVFI